MHKKGHFLFADIIRILAIYFVLVLHSPFPLQNFSIDNFAGLISLSVARTCIPLFVILSGFLLLPKKENYKSFFLKRFTRIFPPWLFWTIIYMLFLLKDIRIQNGMQILNLFKETLQSFWFLPMISSLYLIAPFLRKVVQNISIKDILYIIIIWFLATSLLPYQINSLAFPLRVDDGLLRQTINYSGYFIIGYLIFKNFQKYIKYSISLALILLGLSWIFLNVYLIRPIKPTDALYLVDYISPGIILLSVGLFIGLTCYFMSLEKKLNLKIINAISSISKAALGIYFISNLVILFLTIVGFKFIDIYPPINNYLSALVVFGLSGIIIIALRRIRPISFLIS